MCRRKAASEVYTRAEPPCCCARKAASAASWATFCCTCAAAPGAPGVRCVMSAHPALLSLWRSGRPRALPRVPRCWPRTGQGVSPAARRPALGRSRRPEWAKTQRKACGSRPSPMCVRARRRQRCPNPPITHVLEDPHAVHGQRAPHAAPDHVNGACTSTGRQLKEAVMTMSQTKRWRAKLAHGQEPPTCKGRDAKGVDAGQEPGERPPCCVDLEPCVQIHSQRTCTCVSGASTRKTGDPATGATGKGSWKRSPIAHQTQKAQWMKNHTKKVTKPEIESVAAAL